ncbi:MAG: patatin-like phospholipase family protein [Colwellia sp.]|nr:patatin-like phospholipase family protein [Colwellia sp.]
MLDIYAGENAIKTLKEKGFTADIFTNFLGASGGPKWFTLFGLDKYLFSEFFKNRTQVLNIIGSSAGAFRAACFAQKDPLSAINRLATSYAQTVYSENAKPEEITRKAIELLDEVFGDTGIDEIINNPVMKAHFIVAKSKGLTKFNNKLCQGSGLFSSYLLNKVDRKLLRLQYERFVYQSPTSQISIDDPYNFTTHHVDLTPNNIKQALLASGSIPLVMLGIKNIHGSPKGMYRDGGIIDYHFDFGLRSNLSREKNDGLTLYPHFNAQPKAGWFDKNSSRKVLKKHYDNTVLLVPSLQFIASLPYQKIPDRTDFTQLDAKTRISYWQTVLSQTDQLADDFHKLINGQDLSKIKPLAL